MIWCIILFSNLQFVGSCVLWLGVYWGRYTWVYAVCQPLMFFWQRILTSFVIIKERIRRYTGASFLAYTHLYFVAIHHSLWRLCGAVYKADNSEQDLQQWSRSSWCCLLRHGQWNFWCTLYDTRPTLKSRRPTIYCTSTYSYPDGSRKLLTAASVAGIRQQPRLLLHRCQLKCSQLCHNWAVYCHITEAKLGAHRHISHSRLTVAAITVTVTRLLVDWLSHRSVVSTIAYLWAILSQSVDSHTTRITDSQVHLLIVGKIPQPVRHEARLHCTGM